MAYEEAISISILGTSFLIIYLYTILRNNEENIVNFLLRSFLFLTSLLLIPLNFFVAYHFALSNSDGLSNVIFPIFQLSLWVVVLVVFVLVLYAVFMFFIEMIKGFYKKI